MIAFSLGPITVYWYGIMYLLSFLCGYFFLALVAKKGWVKHYPRLHTILSTKLDDLILAVVLGVILGGRLGEILFYQFSYYWDNPLKVFFVWEGGMSFVGGFVGVLIAVFLFAKKNKLTRFTTAGIFDVLTTFLPFGIIAGRFGNFLNQELYGIPVPGDAWGLSNGFVEFLLVTHYFHIYPNVDNVVRVNTNFLSMTFEGALLLLIMMFLFFTFYRKGKLWPGCMTAIFMIGYAIFRFLFDYLRVDAQVQYYAGLTTTQWFSVLFVVVALSLLISGWHMVRSLYSTHANN